MQESVIFNWTKVPIILFITRNGIRLTLLATCQNSDFVIKMITWKPHIPNNVSVLNQWVIVGAIRIDWWNGNSMRMRPIREKFVKLIIRIEAPPLELRVFRPSSLFSDNQLSSTNVLLLPTQQLQTVILIHPLLTSWTTTMLSRAYTRSWWNLDYLVK